MIFSGFSILKNLAHEQYFEMASLGNKKTEEGTNSGKKGNQLGGRRWGHRRELRTMIHEDEESMVTPTTPCADCNSQFEKYESTMGQQMETANTWRPGVNSVLKTQVW